MNIIRGGIIIPKTNVEVSSKYILQSVDNALRILDLLGEHPELGASEVAKLLGIGRTSAFRLLTTLERRKFINKGMNNKYRLGMKFPYLGSILLNRSSIIRTAHPYLEDLSHQVKENCNLVVLEDDYNVRFIDKVRSPSSLHMETFVGVARPAYCTATGKVLLAYLDEPAIEDYLENMHFKQFTDATIKNAQDFRAVLTEVRKLGYASNIGESEFGLIAYAAPILDLSGKAVAAISVAGPSERIQANREQIISSVKATAAQISNNL